MKNSNFQSIALLSFIIGCIVLGYVAGHYEGHKHENNYEMYPCSTNYVDVAPINQHIWELFGEGDNGLQIRNYIITGNFTDKMGNPCTQIEFQTTTGLLIDEPLPTLPDNCIKYTENGKFYIQCSDINNNLVTIEMQVNN